MKTKRQSHGVDAKAKIVRRLPDMTGHRERVPADLIGATIVEFGTFDDPSLVETGGLVVNYVPAGSNEQRRLVLAFNDVAMWICAPG